jgi:hypothetical protein
MTDIPRGIALEPSDLTLLGAAYDEAWAAISVEFVDADETAVRQARTRLACLMLDLIKLHQLGGEQLKRSSLRLFKSENDRADA